MRRATLLVIGLAVVLPVNVRAEAPKVGDKAPAFTLKASDGKTYSSEQFLGKKPVVIAWFPKAFTGGCTAECKSMRENGEAIREYDVAYFAASVDPVEKNADFAKSLDLDFPILSDPNRKAAESFGVLNKRNMASRVTFYIDKEGVIRHVDSSVKTKRHGKDIADKLKELDIADKK